MSNDNPLNLPGGDVPILGETATIPKALVEELMDTLSTAFMHLRSTDDSNAAANCAEPRYRPLTQRVALAATALAEAAGLVTQQPEQQGLVTL